MYAAEPATPLGRYRLIALLGQGGMADVYLACTQGPRGFQKLLVVKLARFTGDPVFATMFLEEARIAAQLEHPNVVQTYEIAEEGTRHYIVMEYLDGGNLSRLRQRSVKTGGIPLRTSLTILVQVLEGLEYAHEARGLDGRELNVVHRDLSPSNIMVTAQGVVKILDFGIAKATDSYSFTQTGKFSGKLSYMPPEQMRGDSADARADLFAFGVILAEAALNEKMWGTAAGPEIAVKLGQNEIPSLDRATPIDPELRAICARALEPDRALRYASAADLKADLVKHLATLGGPISQKELAQFVKTTLSDDRAKLQLVIDTALQRISSSSTGWSGTTPIPELPRVEQTPATSPVRVPTQAEPTMKNELRFEDSGQVQIITTEPASVAPTIRPQRQKIPMKLIMLGGTLVALTIVLAIVIVGVGKGSSSAPRPAEPTTMTPPPPKPAETARLEIVASPSEATLALDGQPLNANPYVGAYVRDTQVHELVITATGYQPLTHRFALDRDLNLHLNLVRQQATPTVTAVVVAPHHVAAKQAHAKPVAVQPKVVPKVEAKVETKVETPAPSKHSIDTDVYTKPTTKRPIDSNVLDGSGKSKPPIDRNPWEK